MKTERIVSKEIKEVINTETIITCDLCNKKMSHIRTCSMCGRDICEDCTVHDDRTFGDYPTKYCKECWEIGTDYRAKMVELQHECDEKIERLEIGWRNIARNAALQKV